MMIRQVAEGLILGLMCWSANAANVILDFNSATPGGRLTAPYTEDGYTLTSISGHYDIWGNGGAGNTRYLGLDQIDSTSSTVQISGGTFNLVSLHVLYAPYTDFGESQRVTSSAGGSAPLTTVGVQSFSGAAWQNLSWIRLGSNIEIAGPGFDNIILQTVVPVPGSVWMFGAAMGALSMLRRHERLVPRPGFEPGTSRLGGERSIP